MGYDLHITRRDDWVADGPAILLSEWQAYVEACSDMRMDNFAEARLPSGSVLHHEEPGIAVWTAYSRNGIDGNWAWFRYWNGNIDVKIPDAEICQRMLVVARYFDARVQGDEGEFYDTPEDIGRAMPP